MGGYGSNIGSNCISDSKKGSGTNSASSTGMSPVGNFNGSPPEFELREIFGLWAETGISQLNDPNIYPEFFRG